MEIITNDTGKKKKPNKNKIIMIAVTVFLLLAAIVIAFLMFRDNGEMSKDEQKKFEQAQKKYEKLGKKLSKEEYIAMSKKKKPLASADPDEDKKSSSSSKSGSSDSSKDSKLKGNIMTTDKDGKTTSSNSSGDSDSNSDSSGDSSDSSGGSDDGSGSSDAVQGVSGGSDTLDVVDSNPSKTPDDFGKVKIGDGKSNNREDLTALEKENKTTLEKINEDVQFEDENGNTVSANLTEAKIAGQILSEYKKWNYHINNHMGWSSEKYPDWEYNATREFLDEMGEWFINGKEPHDMLTMELGEAAHNYKQALFDLKPYDFFDEHTEYDQRLAGFLKSKPKFNQINSIYINRGHKQFDGLESDAEVIINTDGGTFSAFVGFDEDGVIMYDLY